MEVPETRFKSGGIRVGLKVCLHFAKVNDKTAKCTTCKTVMEEERLNVVGGIGICPKPTETDAQFQQKAVNSRLNTFFQILHS